MTIDKWITMIHVIRLLQIFLPNEEETLQDSCISLNSFFSHALNQVHIFYVYL